MSWAAKRDTKRKEDKAYSLFGIFGVSMPLVYGEGGDKAFRRLREEILKAVQGQSLALFPDSFWIGISSRTLSMYLLIMYGL